MRWPKVIPAGTTNSEITGIIDLLPTFCAIAGVKPPNDRVIDGRNILPYLKGEKVKSIHDSFFVPNATIRYGKWKLLLKDMTPGGQERGWGDRKRAKAGSLFDLEKDVGETNDLSVAYPEIVAKLKKHYELQMKELAANTREIGKTANYTNKKEKAKKKKK